MKVLDSKSHIVDSAVGPLMHTSSTIEGYTIDDYVHTELKALALKLRLAQAIEDADPRFTGNRTLVSAFGKSVGGF